jgi:proteasome lid subunit RPN8/RPN11
MPDTRVDQLTDVPFGEWSPSGPSSLVVTYSREVFDDIRNRVVEAFHCLTKGGIEIGGVLFGTVEGPAPYRVSVQAFLPIECEHAFGPAFQLSPRDEEKLEALLRGASHNAALRHLQPVGWFHSHTRSDIDLAPEDEQVHNRFFPELWQIAVVLRPEKLRPTRVGIFHREPSGAFTTHSPEHEFALHPLQRRRRPALDEPSRNDENPPTRDDRSRPELPAMFLALPPDPLEPEGSEGDSAVDSVAAEWPAAAAADERALPPPAFAGYALDSRAHRSGARVWKWILMLLIVAGVGAGLVARAYWLPETPPPLGFRALDFDGQLRLDWDKLSPAIQEASQAVIEIRDGDRSRTLRVEASELRRGSVTYARHTGTVELRMVVHRPGRLAIEEVTRFLGEPVLLSNDPSSQALRQRDRLESQVQSLREQVDELTVRNERLQRINSALQNRLEVDRVRGAAGKQ